MATRLLSRTLLSRSSLSLLRPLSSISIPSLSTQTITKTRHFSTSQTSSSFNDPNPNWSNRPPKETILQDGCDFEHWLCVVDPPSEEMSRDEIIASYIKILAKVVGSEEEARMKIYSVSTKHYFAFGALVSEELSCKLKELPELRWVLPDAYLDVKNKDYGGEPFINGEAVPYDPKYHAEWVKNNALKTERNRRNDRPRNFDRSRNFERIENVQNQNQGIQTNQDGPRPARNMGSVPHNNMRPSNVGPDNMMSNFMGRYDYEYPVHENRLGIQRDAKNRCKNFTEEEDILLCRAWSIVMGDARSGTNQSSETFWDRTYNLWLYMEEAYEERTPHALRQRFSRIKTAVNKFCGYLAQVQPLSAYNEDAKILRAKEMYLENETKENSKKKKPFAFEHCWRVLKDDRNWMELNSENKTKGFEASLDGSNQDHIVVNDEDTSMPKPDERRIGTKVAKEGHTKGIGKFIYDSSRTLEKMNQTFANNGKLHSDDVTMMIEGDKKLDTYLEIQREILEMQKENLKIQRKKLCMEKEMFDVDIALKEVEFMKFDITTIKDPADKQFFESRKRSIRAKYAEK